MVLGLAITGYEIIAPETTNMPSAFASKKCQDDLTLRPQESGYF